MRSLAAWTVAGGSMIAVSIWSISLFGQQPPNLEGRRVFENRCANCHGPDGGGGELGPSIVRGIATRQGQDLPAFITSGNPGRGMPAFELPAADMTQLVGFLRTLAPPPGRGGPQPARKSITTTDGRTVRGVVVNENAFELQLRTDDGRVAECHGASQVCRVEVSFAKPTGNS